MGLWDCGTVGLWDCGLQALGLQDCGEAEFNLKAVGSIGYGTVGFSRLESASSVQWLDHNVRD